MSENVSPAWYLICELTSLLAACNEGIPCVCVFMSACVRERERVCVCVCVCVTSGIPIRVK